MAYKYRDTYLLIGELWGALDRADYYIDIDKNIAISPEHEYIICINMARDDIDLLSNNGENRLRGYRINESGIKELRLAIGV